MEQKEERKLDFGDYAIVEQKRYGVQNEQYIHKVVTRSQSNAWVDVPVQTPAREVLHDQMEEVVWLICCGVCENEVLKYRLSDVKPYYKKNQLRQDLLTIEYLMQKHPELSEYEAEDPVIMEPTNKPEALTWGKALNEIARSYRIDRHTRYRDWPSLARAFAKSGKSTNYLIGKAAILFAESREIAAFHLGAREQREICVSTLKEHIGPSSLFKDTSAIRSVEAAPAPEFKA